MLGLSGGVDSSVTAAILDKAVGKQLTCLYIDSGLMRKDETKEIEKFFSKSKMNFVVVNAKSDFLRELKGKTDPEQKRKAIGTQFYKTFWDEARKLGFGESDFFAQGTNRADVEETKHAIKTHHNLVKIPADIKFAGLVEPLRDLYKDEVRAVGKILGLHDDLVQRQPFPGPGLGVRVMGEVTEAKLAILREADAIFRAEIKAAKLNPAQYFVAISVEKATAIQDGKRLDGNIFYLRAIETKDFLCADVTRVPYEVFDKVVARIFREVPNTARVMYDLSPKRNRGTSATVEYQ